MTLKQRTEKKVEIDIEQSFSHLQNSKEMTSTDEVCIFFLILAEMLCSTISENITESAMKQITKELGHRVIRKLGIPTYTNKNHDLYKPFQLSLLQRSKTHLCLDDDLDTLILLYKDVLQENTPNFTLKLYTSRNRCFYSYTVKALQTRSEVDLDVLLCNSLNKNELLELLNKYRTQNE